MKYLFLTFFATFSIKISAQIELPRHDANSKTTIVNTIGRYTYSYNPDARTPNWVAYKLTASDIGGGTSKLVFGGLGSQSTSNAVRHKRTLLTLGLR